jgi:hypothetical protein
MKFSKLFSAIIVLLLIVSCGSTKTTTDKKSETSVVNDTKQFQIRTIAFYNLENLFDPFDDTTIQDEKSPIMEMKKANRPEAYQKKLVNMAKVLSEIGIDEKIKKAPAIIGVCEIENKRVLQDLIAESQLVDKNYGIVHYNSPDARGIDVALLYQKRYFKVMDSKTYTLELPSGYDTRDQLLVTGLLDDEVVHIIVNHWPSRRGGEKKSRPSREAAAALNMKIIADF